MLLQMDNRKCQSTIKMKKIQNEVGVPDKINHYLSYPDMIFLNRVIWLYPCF